jgi:hypothetical protein
MHKGKAPKLKATNESSHLCQFFDAGADKWDFIVLGHLYRVLQLTQDVAGQFMHLDNVAEDVLQVLQTTGHIVRPCSCKFM